MIKIHEDIVHSVQHETKEADWAVKITRRIFETNPILFGLLQQMEKKIGSIGLSYVLLMYRFIESQLEVNEMELGDDPDQTGTDRPDQTG